MGCSPARSCHDGTTIPIVGSVVAGPVSDRLQRRQAFVIGSSALAMTAVAIPLAVPTTTGMYAFSVVGGLAFGIYYAVDAALMSEVLPAQESHARDVGILNMANTRGQVPAPAASSLLVGLGLGFVPVFVGASIAGALGAACIRRSSPSVDGVRQVLLVIFGQAPDLEIQET